jgi:outer membrane protein OmpA-like peptidoglycan-associated protein
VKSAVRYSVPVRLAFAAATLALLTRCAPPPPPPTPEPEPVPVGDLDIKGAAAHIVREFAEQFVAVAGTRIITIDPMLDRATGQQTGVTRILEAEVGPAIAEHLPAATLVRFDGEGAAQARYVVSGTVAAGGSAGRYTAHVSVTDRQTGLVVAQSSAPFVQAGLDGSPTRFYSESPVLVRDRSTDGYVRTAETTAGRAADSLYIAQLSTAALLAEALAAFNAERWDEALTMYRAAAQRPDGQQLRTFNGVYLSSIKLRRARDAEDAFGKIAELGLATNNLSVKLLFRPGSATEFWQGPEFSAVYPMWIRQIARAAQTARSCLNVVGHTSRTGTEAVNDRLSVARAETVKRLLEAQVRALAPRLRASGVGYRENVVGTGTDDASDAPDRRVEFKVVDCPAR